MIKIEFDASSNPVRYRATATNCTEMKEMETDLNIKVIRLFNDVVETDIRVIRVTAVSEGFVHWNDISLKHEGLYSYSYHNGVEMVSDSFLYGSKRETKVKITKRLGNRKAVIMKFPLPLKKDDIKLEYSQEGGEPIVIPICMSGSECNFVIKADVKAWLRFSDELRRMVHISDRSL